MQNAKVVEVVLFKPAPEVSEADVLKTTAMMQTKVMTMPGYIDRQLLKNSDGQWVDLVWWESMEQAQSAAEAIMGDEDLAPYMFVFDNAEMTMFHLAPVALTTE